MLIIWTDWNGDMYAFCSRECLEHYRGWTSDPNYPFEKATFTDPDVSFGCMWCAGDLTEGVTWLPASEPEKPEEQAEK